MNKKEDIDIWKDEQKSRSAGFKVPESYFENLEKDILAKTILSTDSTTTKLVILNTWIKVGIASAAALIIAFVLLFPHSNSLPMELAYENDLEQYAYYEEDWIAQEIDKLEFDDIDSFMEEEINSLIADGVTSNEILDIYLNK